MLLIVWWKIAEYFAKSHHSPFIRNSAQRSGWIFQLSIMWEEKYLLENEIKIFFVSKNIKLDGMGSGKKSHEIWRVKIIE